MSRYSEVHRQTACAPVCCCVRRSVFCVGCELTEDGDRPKHVAARQGEIYISVICAFFRLRVCDQTQCTERILRK